MTFWENQKYVEMTKRQVLEGTSKWSAKVAIKGLCSSSSLVDVVKNKY